MNKKKINKDTEDELTLEELLQEAPAPMELPAFLKEQKNQFWIALLGATCFACLPTLIIWSKNAGGLNFIEGLFPVIISLAVGLLFFCAFWFISRRNALVTPFISSVATFFVLSFNAFCGIANRLLPFLPLPIGALIVGTVLSGLAVLAVIKLKNWKFTPLVLAVCSFTMAVLLVFNVIRIIPPTIARGIQKNAYASIQSPETIPAKALDQNSDQPNLYHFILDECGDFYTMEKYYDMPVAENPFFQFLEERGFNISQNSVSRTNLSIFSAANMACLNYVCDEATTEPMARELFFEGEWFKNLKDMGYSSYSVSSHITHYLQLQELTTPRLDETLLCSVTDEGATVLDLMVDRSILYLASSSSSSSLSKLSADIFMRRLERVSAFFADPSNYTYATPMAIHTYLLSPHTPFFCDAKGETISSRYRCNWVDTRYYRDQYLYTTSVFLADIIDNILANDPTAIIVVQSDHGIRGGLYTAESYDIEKQDQERILNAVYFGGESLDIEGLSSVNTARLIMTKLGKDCPPVSDDVPALYK